jgi:hypothetical protein
VRVRKIYLEWREDQKYLLGVEVTECGSERSTSSGGRENHPGMKIRNLYYEWGARGSP